MKRKHFSDEQIIGILNEAAAGAAAVEVCRISDFLPRLRRFRSPYWRRAKPSPPPSDGC